MSAGFQYNDVPASITAAARVFEQLETEIAVTSDSSFNHAKILPKQGQTQTSSCAGTGKGLNQPNVAPALA